MIQKIQDSASTRSLGVRVGLRNEIDSWNANRESCPHHGLKHRLRAGRCRNACGERIHGLRIHARLFREECRSQGKLWSAFAKEEDLALFVPDLDVTSDESVEAAVQEIARQSGRIDVVINNAGIASLGITEGYTFRSGSDCSMSISSVLCV